MRSGSEYDPCKKLLVNLKTIGWIILNKKAEKVESKIVVMLLGRHFVHSTVISIIQKVKIKFLII